MFCSELAQIIIGCCHCTHCCVSVCFALSVRCDIVDCDCVSDGYLLSLDDRRCYLEKVVKMMQSVGIIFYVYSLEQVGFPLNISIFACSLMVLKLQYV